MEEETATVLETGRSRGLLGRLLGFYLSPAETFTAIVRRPRFLWPAFALVGLNLGFAAAWASRVNPGEFTKAQLEESGLWEKIPPERQGAMLDPARASGFAVRALAGSVVGVVLTLLLVGGVLLFVFRFFYASEVTFRQSLTIAAWSFLVVSLVYLPLVLVSLAVNGDWNVSPAEAFEANVALFLDRQSSSRPLYALASSFDLFVFWRIFLLASGFAVASARRVSSAVFGVAVPWGLLVLLKVGFVALTGWSLPF